MRDRVTRLSSYVLLRDSGKILLCRLSLRTATPGMWTLPGGGLEFGESPEQAVTREVLEETGLQVRDLKLEEIWNSAETFHGRDYHLLRFIYSGKFTPSDLKMEEDGSTDQCEWIEESRLEETPLVPLVRHALKHLKDFDPA